MIYKQKKIQFSSYSGLYNIIVPKDNLLRKINDLIITAAIVTTGEKGDGPELPRLMEVSQQNGMEVDTIFPFD